MPRMTIYATDSPQQQVVGSEVKIWDAVLTAGKRRKVRRKLDGEASWCTPGSQEKMAGFEIEQV